MGTAAAGLGRRGARAPWRGCDDRAAGRAARTDAARPDRASPRAGHGGHRPGGRGPRLRERGRRAARGRQRVRDYARRSRHQRLHERDAGAHAGPGVADPLPQLGAQRRRGLLEHRHRLDAALHRAHGLGGHLRRGVVTSHGVLGVGVVLAPAAGPGTLARVRWRTARGTERTAPLARNLAAVADNAMAGCMPFCEAVAMRQPRIIRVGLSPSLLLEMEFDFPVSP